MSAEDNGLPYAQRKAEDAPGQWLLARLGKSVLRPGGLGLTRQLLEQARIPGADVVELATDREPSWAGECCRMIFEDHELSGTRTGMLSMDCTVKNCEV